MNILLISIGKSLRKILAHYRNPIMEYIIDKKVDNIAQQV